MLANPRSTFLLACLPACLTYRSDSARLHSVSPSRQVIKLVLHRISRLAICLLIFVKPQLPRFEYGLSGSVRVGSGSQICVRYRWFGCVDWSCWCEALCLGPWLWKCLGYWDRLCVGYWCSSTGVLCCLRKCDQARHICLCLKSKQKVRRIILVMVRSYFQVGSPGT